jgi:hypothetical protein
VIVVFGANGTAVWRASRVKGAPLRVRCLNDGFEFRVPSSSAPDLPAAFTLIQQHTVPIVGTVRFVTGFQLDS